MLSLESPHLDFPQVSFDVFFLAASGHCSCMCDYFFTYVDTDSARPCSLSSLDWPLYLGDASTFPVGFPLVMEWSHWEPLSTQEVTIEWEHRGKKYFAWDFFGWCTLCVQTHNVGTYYGMNTGHVYLCHVNEKMPAVYRHSTHFKTIQWEHTGTWGCMPLCTGDQFTPLTWSFPPNPASAVMLWKTQCWSS